MHILHTVENYYPSTGGMQEVVKQLSERLVSLGHHVTVATKANPGRKNLETINGVKIYSFAIEGNAANGMKGEIESYLNFLKEGNYDIITNFAAQQFATDLCLPLLKELKGAKVFVPTGFSGLYMQEYSSYFERMKTWMKDYDLNIFLSNDYRDINFARSNGIANTIIIPNGADEREFLNDNNLNESQFENDGFKILHVGSFTKVKGHQEAIEIFLKANIRKATLLFVCNNAKELQAMIKTNIVLRIKIMLYQWIHKKKIIVKALNRAKTVLAYKEADAFLFPSNIECSPIVLFEAMASKTPFLSSDVGNAREIVEWSNEGGIILPTHINEYGYSYVDIEESAKVLTKIAKDPELRLEMASKGFAQWKKNFSWKAISLDYEREYKKLYNSSK